MALPPSVSLPTTGSDPKVATKEYLETQINDAFVEAYNELCHFEDFDEVDNTPDADKPISTAQLAAFEVVAGLTGPIALETETTGTNTITASIPASIVGLGVSLVNDVQVMFRAPAANTGDVTLMGYPLREQDGVTELPAGSLKGGRRYLARFSTVGGSHFRLMDSGLMPSEIVETEIVNLRAQSSVIVLDTEGTGTNSITASIPTSFDGVGLIDNTVVMFRAPAANTGDVTLMGLPLRYSDGTTELDPGELQAGRRCLAAFNTFGGDHFRLMSSGVTNADIKAKDDAVLDALSSAALAAGTYSPLIPLIGKIGRFINFADKHSLWQDSARTIPVKNDGDPIGRVDDLSGNGFHYTAESDVRRPTWKKSTLGAAGLARFAAGADAAQAQYLTGVSNDMTNGAEKVTIFALASFGNRGGNQAIAQHSINASTTSARLTLQATNKRPNVQVRSDDSTSVVSYSYKLGGDNWNMQYGELVLFEAVADIANKDALIWSNGYNTIEGVEELPAGTDAFNASDEGANYLSHPVNRLEGDIVALVEIVGDITPRDREGIYTFFKGLADDVTVGDLERYDPDGDLPVVFFWFNYPNVWNLGADKFLVGGVTAGGTIMVGEYDFDGQTEAQSISHSVLYDFLEIDDHNIPSFCELPDGNMLAMYSAHNRDGRVLANKTTTPGDYTSWGAAVDVGPQIQNHPTNDFLVSYNFLFRHTGESDRLYFIHREGDKTLAGSDSILTQEFWTISWSDDGGDTWERSHKLWGPQRPYTRAFSNGVDRIDFFFNDSHPNADSTNRVHHCYLTGGNFYKSDGTLIGALGSALPLDLDTDPTLVYDADAATTGNAWVWDLCHDSATGRPVGTYVTYEDGYDTINYWQARWTGSAWTLHQITPVGASLTPTQVVYTGGVVTDPEDINTVYCSIMVDANGGVTTDRDIGTYQVFRFTSGDSGATWSGTQLTFEEKDAFRPVIAPDARRVFYVTGDYGPHYTRYVTKVKYLDIS